MKKRIFRKTPGGRVVVHYKRKKPKKQRCGRCDKVLGGTSGLISSRVRKMKHSERIPSSPYAGVLCVNCLDSLIRYTTRFGVKYRYPEYNDMELRRDLTIEKFLPREWFKGLSKEKAELPKAKKEVAEKKIIKKAEKKLKKKPEKKAEKKLEKKPKKKVVKKSSKAK